MLRARLELRMNGHTLQDEDLMGICGEEVSVIIDDVSPLSSLSLSQPFHLHQILLPVQVPEFLRKLSLCLFVHRLSIFGLCAPRVLRLDPASLLMIPEILLQEVKHQWHELKKGMWIISYEV